jgi:hypothetical protein
VRLRTLALAAVLVVVLAPAASADPVGVSVKLCGPSSAADGSRAMLTATLRDPERADGMRSTVIMQDKDGHLVRIGSKAITLTRGGRLSTMTFMVKAGASAAGIARCRTAWMHPEGTGTAPCGRPAA